MQENLLFRTFDGQEIELPVNPAQTIDDLIVTIQNTLNDEKYANICLIFKGKRLDPSETVSTIGHVEEGEFIIIKTVKAKAKPNAQQTSLPEGENKKPVFSESPEPISQNQYSGPSSQPVHRRPKRGLPLRTEILVPKSDPPDFDEKVQALVELGDGRFTRENVEKALRVSFFNPDRASTYLFSGNIPDSPEPKVNTPPKKPNDQENSNNDSKFDQLPDEQKELIMILVDETGKDFPLVLQVGFACDFNENNMRDILSQE